MSSGSRLICVNSGGNVSLWYWWTRNVHSRRLFSFQTRLGTWEDGTGLCPLGAEAKNLIPACSTRYICPASTWSCNPKCVWGMLGLYRGDRLGFLQVRIANLWYVKGGFDNQTGHVCHHFPQVSPFDFPVSCRPAFPNASTVCWTWETATVACYFHNHQLVFGWCSLQLMPCCTWPMSHLYNAATAHCYILH